MPRHLHVKRLLVVSPDELQFVRSSRWCRVKGKCFPVYPTPRLFKLISLNTCHSATFTYRDLLFVNLFLSIIYNVVNFPPMSTWFRKKNKGVCVQICDLQVKITAVAIRVNLKWIYFKEIKNFTCWTQDLKGFNFAIPPLWFLWTIPPLKGWGMNRRPLCMSTFSRHQYNLTTVLFTLATTSE